MTIFAELINLSEGGAFVRTSVPMSPGWRAQLSFGLGGSPDASVKVEAVVVWQRPFAARLGAPEQAGMGFRFEGVPKGLAERIRGYVTGLLNG